MKLIRFFIDRPIFASVISILIFLAGLVSVFQLPISEYPEVSPPSVVITARFPGASPSDIAETVASPLEEQLSGVDDMLYFNSLSTTDGLLQIRVTFKIGADVDLSQQLVQNRVQQALPRLPETVRQLGVTVTKSSPDLTMVVHLTSPSERYDILYLRNYAVLNVRDELSKVTGVGNVGTFGSGDYAMRIWINPNKAAQRNLTTDEIIAAIREQNNQVAAGIIGGPPYTENSPSGLQLPIQIKGRLESVSEFESIIVKRSPNGEITRLKDIARIELDAAQYTLRSLLNNKPAVALPIFASPGANALQISSDIRQKMKELKPYFPEGVDYEIVYDPTTFVRDSIHSVIETLIETVLLVVFVVVLFLQRWRVALIPLLAVPVSIVGTFTLMYLLGFSINVLSLFGLILAIGVVVDDAIVVVENVARNIESGLSPRDATIKAMKEVTGPVIATSLVLMGVFIPISFLSGLTGMFYKQFSMTIAIAVIISTINSLTLSPALSAHLLQDMSNRGDWLQGLLDKYFGWMFRGFNFILDRFNIKYESGLVYSLKRKTLLSIIFAILIGVTFLGFNLTPKGFIPAQDKQYLIAFAQLPQGSSLDRTEEVIRKMSEAALNQPGVNNAIAFPGLSINGFVNNSSSGIIFVALKPFKERKGENTGAFAIAKQLQQKFMTIPGAYIAIFPPPPVRGLGTAGGFKLQIEDRLDRGYEALNNVVREVTTKANQHPALSRVYSGYSIDTPQLLANLDRTKAEQLGIDMGSVFRTMQTYLGSQYVNDFNLFGRTYQVIAQAESEFRDQTDDMLKLKVRNKAGEMVPLGAVISTSEIKGPSISMHYNGYRSADINGDSAPGYSSGDARKAIEDVLQDTLPSGMAFEWTDLTYQQILAGNTAIFIFPLCLFLVFLILAAQYESLSMPLAIIMIVPMSILSAIFGVYFTGGDNNIFTQISFFVLSGLASKNAILIVEFAKEKENEGMPVLQATIQASLLRLRPILMTSFSFIIGVLPLVFSTGAGSEMRKDIGIAVFFGMLGVTVLGLIFTPLFYVIIRKIELFLKHRKEARS